MFFCLMHSGSQISDEVRSVLLQVARDMLRDRLTVLSFEADTCEGCVNTRAERGSLGSVYGQKFSAEVVTDAGILTVTFIVREDVGNWKIDEGVWGDIPILQPEPASSVRITHSAPRMMQ